MRVYDWEMEHGHGVIGISVLDRSTLVVVYD